MKTYLEIVRDKDSKVVKRLDVTGKSERSIEKIEDGINVNLNHNEYSVNKTQSKVELEII